MPIYAYVLQLVSFPQALQQNAVCTSSISLCATCPTQLILPDVITIKIFHEEYKSSKCNFLHSPVSLKQLPQHPLTHQIPHAHKTPVLYILIFMFLNTKLADKRFRTDRQQQQQFPEINVHFI
jgi:hypothetical protein